MRKNIVFDLDGVLLESGLQRAAFAEAVHIETGLTITPTEENNFEAMPTTYKLKVMVNAGRITSEQAVRIGERKKQITSGIFAQATIDKQHIDMIRQLVREGYSVQIASNAIEESVGYFVNKHNLQVPYLGNDSPWVKAPKPHPSIYLTAMQRGGFGPHETLIVEDSEVGLEAAHLSGAKVLAVKNPADLTYEKVIAAATEAEAFPSPLTNILVPMAGAGERFRRAGYEPIKPLIPVGNRFMLDVAVKSLGVNGRHIFIARKQDAEQYPLACITNLISPGNRLVLSDGPTEGAVSTTLLAADLIDNDHELMIVNSDQYIEWDAAQFFRYARGGGWAGVTLTFRDTDPKGGFGRKEGERVVEVAEKNPISDIANVGIYWWRRGSDYVRCAKEMVARNTRVNNEFYVAPVYNEAIRHGMKIGSFDVKSMHGLGTPEDLQRFLQ